MSIERIDFRFPGLPGVRCVFTARGGGRSDGPWASSNLSLEVGDDKAAVRANREALRHELGLRVWQELRQVHGQTVHMDLEGDFFEGAKLEGDGLCTSRPGHALVMKTADCQALLMADRAGRHVAALHCGWRGNAVNFPAAGVGAFCERYGIPPADVLVVRGPRPAHVRRRQTLQHLLPGHLHGLVPAVLLLPPGQNHRPPGRHHLDRIA